MLRQRKTLVALLSGLLLSFAAQAGKLAIVIDDVGYRPTEENKVLQMPQAISVAVLPDAPYARQMAIKAHQGGHEVLIHLPMAPLSKQPLEKNTLTPEMSSAEIDRIIRSAVNNVPYAVGLNNHMGSKMTSSLPGMQKVMQALNQYNLYFLDSMTIGNSQSVPAAQGTHVRVLKRRVFLDDSQDINAIRQQFSRAVKLAERDGYAIAIGHPHPNTVRVLQQMLPTLPADITLVTPGQLLNEPLRNGSASPAKTLPRNKPAQGFQPPGECKVKQPLSPVPATRALGVIGESIAESPLYRRINALF
ncbi:divergent polysaccharide deacetylase family protein [Pantoea stewartii subsp. indologenes]|uniref:divergent polysaccharide deacetylase family protein n=1 Tax=Pantoea stewartii TaxID=66269 RepID=UPI001981FADA|nr:divergent polysaccharide deacetylase family protein [Pantoea stewartii]MCU7367510.1 divergent polysaccharide deacetylase family protein [Pantoea stewartii]MDK2635503.1 divergent polysaccharide deacetylase family protein [Pantoea stewartii subsp. indologenes]